MSPIENVVPNLVENSANENLEQLRNKPDRSRDLFGVQLEVTSLLLEAERRKLAVLQKELQVALEEGGSIKAKEHQKQELLVAITRIQAQHDHLDKEYREHALDALLSANTRGFGKRQTDLFHPPIGLSNATLCAAKRRLIQPVRESTPTPQRARYSDRQCSFVSVKKCSNKMQQECSKPEKPKILGPKPTIPSKPKNVPPVNVRPPRITSRRVKPPSEPSEKCDKYYTETFKKLEDVIPKAPNSPSTVCCSILSNANADCCGIINVNKKELNGKSMTKIDSLDSNSSDSGGFKDFIQLDLIKKSTESEMGMQPDFLADRPRKDMRQSAQALAPFLPQAEQKLKSLSVEREEHFRQQLAKFNTKTDDVKTKPKPQIISQSQFQQSTRKLEELLSQRVEKEKIMVRKGGPNCLIDGECSQDVEQKMMVQKQMQQKLQADLQQTVKQIQEIQSIELRLPQNRKWSESNRSQPAIGLKHTPKSRREEETFDTASSQVFMRMDDPEIQETVESILGKGAKVVDCEKKSSIKEEEVLFINGIPVTLEGRDGVAIKQALITGQVPPCDLLNTLLIKTGILKAPVKLDTSLSVKSTTVTKEEVTVSKDGKVVDERSRETKEQNFYTSAITEVYEPVKVVPRAELLNGKHTRRRYAENGYETASDGKFESSSSTSSCESDHHFKQQNCSSKDSGHLSNSTFTKVDFTPSSVDSLSSLDETDFLSDQFRKCTPLNGYRKDFTPTIFGTVASDLTPKDCSNRRSLPQTPQTKSFSAVFNGEAVQESAAESALQQDNALVYRDGNLLSGSLEALIQHMVPTDIYYPDRAYLFAFLLSSRLFIKPHDLLARVRSLCETQQALGSATGGCSHPGQARFAEHLVQLLAEWTETFPYDYRDDRVMQHVRTITQQCCTINPSIRTNVSSLLHNLLQRLTALDQYEKTLDPSSQPQDENCTDISEVCPVPAILAQQLTHVELERLSFIGPEEFVQAFAKENPHLETSFKDMKKTHNLEQYVQWFNRLSYFVATQVCKYQKKKQRVRVVEYWIETGRECFNIGNFNSLMAIIAGLNMSPISRLKKTWNKIHSGKFAILEHQMDPSSNFSSYRSTLKAAMWRSHGAKDQRQRIVIPFFSLLVKDLYFLNQGCSNKLPNGHINFEKFWQLAKQVTEFMAWKQVTCPFEKDPKVISILQHGPILNENALALASFECEPPENNQEKERCKTLKADSSAT